MAGALTISTLNNDTGVLATQNGMTGIAKAWVNFNGVTTVTINGSFNVSSVTRNGTGLYTINFTTALPNANYAASGSASRSSSTSSISYLAPSTNTTYTTTAFQFYTTNDAGAAEDSARCGVVIFSS